MNTLINRKKIVLFWLLMVFWSVACTAEQPPPAANTVALPSPTATIPPTATLTPTVTPSPLPPTATPTPAPLSPSAIFELVSPSIVYVETPYGSGSAILIEGNYLLTNAHVVWPFDEVRAVFADRTEFETVPLLNWDQTADLAVLGPLPDAPAQPLMLVDGEASVVGSDVYLVGYPGEVDTFPEPSMTRGLISRVREWERASITYFQTDAMIAGGQSGGALVSEMGDVIGISGFAFGDAEFGLVASASDLTDRVAQLIAGEDTSGQGQRLVDHSAGKQTLAARIRHEQDTIAFLVGHDCGPTLDVEAESEADLVLQLYDMSTDHSQEFDEGSTGAERFSHATTGNRPLVVAVYSYDGSLGTVHMQSSCDLIALQDEDDETTLHVGDTVSGVLDFPGDVDLFYLTMDENESVNFVVDSASTDPYMWITYAEARWDGWVDDDDSGGGLFGENVELTFQAAHPDRYLVFVMDSNGYNVGGYTIMVGEGGESPVATIPPTPAPIVTDYGPMQVYESARYPYTMQIPATWEDVTASNPDCDGTCFASEDSFSYLVISEADVEELAGEAGDAISREQYVSLILQSVGTFLPGATLQWQESTTTPGGLRVDTAHYVVRESGVTLHMKLVIAFENGIGFNAMYVVLDATYAQLEPVIDYTLTTVALTP